MAEIPEYVSDHAAVLSDGWVVSMDEVFVRLFSLVLLLGGTSPVRN
jgi:hypothetical protein